MFDWPPGLLHTQRGFRDYQQGAKPSFQHLSCGDALLHAPELSRLRNACRARAELSSIAWMHSVARGSCPQILLRNPDRHACDRAIRRAASLMVVIPNEVRDLTFGTADHIRIQWAILGPIGRSFASLRMTFWLSVEC